MRWRLLFRERRFSRIDAEGGSYERSCEKAMPVLLTKEHKSEITLSIRRFVADELDHEVSEIQAGFLLDYFLQEIAPFAYNSGVEDAQKHLIRNAEDLSGTIFEEPLTYWDNHGGARGVRRKPGN